MKMRSKVGRDITIMAVGAVALGLLGVWLLPDRLAKGQEKAAVTAAPGERDANQGRAQAPVGEARERQEEEQGVTFRFPLTAKFHIPDAYNVATLIDGSTLLRQPFRAQLKYQFVLVEDGGECTLLSRRQAEPNIQRFPTVRVERMPRGFTLTFVGVEPKAISQATFATMEAAVADYQRWLERAYGIGRIGKDQNKPAWLANVKLVFTVDMWRPNGEISHDYQDVINLIGDLAKAGAPKDTLLYLPGWSGPYDAWYPEYRPVMELGGAEKFRELVEAAHKNGYRVMIHTSPGLVDPYQPAFEERWKKWARKEPEEEGGGFIMWPGGIPTKALEFDSGRQPLKATTATVTVPDVCEARLTVGDFGKERFAATVGDRTLRMPLDVSDPYTFPFTFFFYKGENQIRFSSLAARRSSLPSGMWYRAHEAVQFPGVWTRPLVNMSPDAAEWRSYNVEKIVAAVREYGIDAVHLDALVQQSWAWVPLYEELQRRLPSVAFSNEKNVGEAGLRFISLTQGNRVELPEGRKASAVCQKLVEPYLRFYRHLCGAGSFVPVGSVCSVHPPAVELEEGAEGLHRHLRSAERLGVIRTLRLNYRKFGLDAETRQEVKRRR